MSLSDTQLLGVLTGQQLQLQSKIQDLQNQAVQLQTQYDTGNYNFHHNPVFFKDPNHAQDNASQNPSYFSTENALTELLNKKADIINNLIPEAQSQLDSINFQIQGQKTAQTQARQNVVSPVPVIPTPTAEPAPVQVNRDTTPVSIIPTPVAASAPPQVDRGTTTNPVISSPSTTPTTSGTTTTPSLSLQKIAVVGVALFAGLSLWLSPKGKRK